MHTTTADARHKALNDYELRGLSHLDMLRDLMRPYARMEPEMVHELARALVHTHGVPVEIVTHDPDAHWKAPYEFVLLHLAIDLSELEELLEGAPLGTRTEAERAVDLVHAVEVETVWWSSLIIDLGGFGRTEHKGEGVVQQLAGKRFTDEVFVSVNADGLPCSDDAYYELTLALCPA